MLRLEAIEPRHLVAARQMRLGLVRQPREEGRVRLPDRLLLVAGRQPFQPELAHRLQHPVARLLGRQAADLLHDALLDQRRDAVEDGGGGGGGGGGGLNVSSAPAAPDRLRPLEGEAAVPVYFAGEHANSFYEFQGFMEGAVLSGVQAAVEILRAAKHGRAA